MIFTDKAFNMRQIIVLGKYLGGRTKTDRLTCVKYRYAINYRQVFRELCSC